MEVIKCRKNCSCDIVVSVYAYVHVWVCMYVCACSYGVGTHCEGSRTTLDVFLRCYPRTHPGTLWAGYMGCIESPRVLSNSSSPVLDYKCSISHTILSFLKHGSSHKLSPRVCRANPSLGYFLNIFFVILASSYRLGSFPVFCQHTSRALWWLQYYYTLHIILKAILFTSDKISFAVESRCSWVCWTPFQ